MSMLVRQQCLIRCQRQKAVLTLSLAARKEKWTPYFEGLVSPFHCGGKWEAMVAPTAALDSLKLHWVNQWLCGQENEDEVLWNQATSEK